MTIGGSGSMVGDAPEWTPKPWGGELLLMCNETYAVKILHIRQGCRTSLQYHRVKRETLLPGSGSLTLETRRDGRMVEDTLAESVTLLPGTVHRLRAVTDAEVVEVSSTELDDVVRLEDDYGRTGLAHPLR
jgi:D-lyxose ketol-isomerase